MSLKPCVGSLYWKVKKQSKTVLFTTKHDIIIKIEEEDYYSDDECDYVLESNNYLDQYIREERWWDFF